MSKNLLKKWISFHRLSILLLLSSLTFSATAQPAQDTSGRYFVRGIRSDSLIVDVSDSTLKPLDFPCARKFMFTTTGEAAEFLPYIKDDPNFSLWYVYIYDEAGNFDGDNSQWNNTPFSITLDTPGLYTLKFAIPTAGGPDTVVKFQMLVIPKIQKVWIEADPICDNWTPAAQQNDGRYHFKVKTEPDITEVMRFINKYTHGGISPNCNKDESLLLSFFGNAGAFVDPYLSSNNANIYRKYNFPLPFGIVPELLDFIGSAWNNTNYPYPNDYYMFYASDSLNPGYNTLKDYLAGGTLYGDSLYINVHIFDGVNPAGYKVSAPLLIGQQYHLDDYTVTGNEVWTPTSNPGTALYGGTINKLRIKNTLTVNAEALLTVNGMTLEFGPDAWVTVHAGNQPTFDYAGYLELNNSTFTAMRDCGNNSMWGGLYVEGKPNQTQVYPYNGKVIMNNSTLSYSKYGLFPWDPIYAHTGGICIANNSTFKRNTTSMTMGGYRNISPFTNQEINNQSYFYNCEFINDTILPLPFRQFFVGTDVKGMAFKACRFSSIDQSGKGINGADMSLTVDHQIIQHLTYTDTILSTFTGLNKAISLASTGRPAGLTVKHTTFHENFYGTYLSAVSVPLIKYNNYKMKTTYYAETFDPYNTGVAIFSGTGYMVHNNNFIRTTALIIPYVANVGVLVSNSGSSSNQINNNYYDHMGNGNLSNYKNVNSAIVPPHTGLQFLCNNYVGSRTDEAARGDNNATQGIADWQGSPAVSAGNTLGGMLNLYNLVNEVRPITYHYYGSAPNYLGVVTVTAATANSACTQPADPDDNPNTRFPNNGKFGATVRTISTGQLTPPHLTDATLLYPPTSSGTTYLTRQQVYYNINYYMNDSVGMEHQDSLRFWTIQAQTAHTDLLLCDLLVRDGVDSSVVFSVYDSIARWYSLDSVERREFRFGRKLMKMKLAMTSIHADTSRPGYIPDSAWVSTLEQIVDSANMWAKIVAQDWLTTFDGREFTNPVLYAIDSASDTLIAHRPAFNNELIGRVTSVQTSNNYLFPNPVHDFLYVNYVGEDGKAATIDIVDVTGRVVKKMTLTQGSMPASINLRGLTAGIYFYRITENGVVKMQGKLAKD